MQYVFMIDTDDYFVFDADYRAAWRRGGAVSLTQQETRFLLHFARRRDGFAETEQLIDALSHDEGTPKAVIECVRRLRAKLEKIGLGKQAAIMADVRGGYRLKPALVAIGWETSPEDMPALARKALEDRLSSHPIDDFSSLEGLLSTAHAAIRSGDYHENDETLRLIIAAYDLGVFDHWRDRTDLRKSLAGSMVDLCHAKAYQAQRGDQTYAVETRYLFDRAQFLAGTLPKHNPGLQERLASHYTDFLGIADRGLEAMGRHVSKNLVSINPDAENLLYPAQRKIIIAAAEAGDIAAYENADEAIDRHIENISGRDADETAFHILQGSAVATIIMSRTQPSFRDYFLSRSSSRLDQCKDIEASVKNLMFKRHYWLTSIEFEVELSAGEIPLTLANRLVRIRDECRRDRADGVADWADDIIRRLRVDRHRHDVDQ